MPEDKIEVKLWKKKLETYTDLRQGNSYSRSIEESIEFLFPPSSTITGSITSSGSPIR